MQPTPYALWGSMWSSAIALAENAGVVSEMIRASVEVANVRSRSIWQAAANPLGADYRELGRMVTEKIDAFSEAGAAALNDVRHMQNDALGQWRQTLALASGARALTAGEASIFLARQTRMLDRAVTAGGKVMAPIHSRATANAKRLGKRR